MLFNLTPETYLIYYAAVTQIQDPVPFELLGTFGLLQDKIEAAGEKKDGSFRIQPPGISMEFSDAERVFLLECIPLVRWHCSGSRWVVKAYNELKNDIG